MSAQEPRVTLLTAKEAADHLRVSVRTLERLIDKPDGIPVTWILGSRRFRLDLLDRYVEANTASN